MKFFRALGQAIRLGSGQWLWGGARLYGCLFFGFFILFAVAWVFGFSPAEVSAWLDAHGGLWRSIGGILWRIFWAFVLLICIYAFVGGLYERFWPAARTRRRKIMDEHLQRPVRDGVGVPEPVEDAPIGCFGFGLAVVVGYIAWVAISMPLD